VIRDGRIALIDESYRRLTGRQLVQTQDDLALAFWNAPRAIVAHGTEADPIFFYGNALALELFEMSADVFTRLPSRLSAEAMQREERTRLLDCVTRNGFIDDYAGIRISATRQRFRIVQATVWNLIDAAGVVHGQAATFDRWTMLDRAR